MTGLAKVLFAGQLMQRRELQSRPRGRLARRDLHRARQTCPDRRSTKRHLLAPTILLQLVRADRRSRRPRKTRTTNNRSANLRHSKKPTPHAWAFLWMDTESLGGFHRGRLGLLERLIV